MTGERVNARTPKRPGSRLAKGNQFYVLAKITTTTNNFLEALHREWSCMGRPQESGRRKIYKKKYVRTIKKS